MHTLTSCVPLHPGQKSKTLNPERKTFVFCLVLLVDVLPVLPCCPCRTEEYAEALSALQSTISGKKRAQGGPVSWEQAFENLRNYLQASRAPPCLLLESPSQHSIIIIKPSKKMHRDKQRILVLPPHTRRLLLVLSEDGHRRRRQQA